MTSSVNLYMILVRYAFGSMVIDIFEPNIMITYLLLLLKIVSYNLGTSFGSNLT